MRMKLFEENRVRSRCRVKNNSQTPIFMNIKSEKRIRRHRRIRSKVKGTASRPRLAIYKSNKYFYAQIIDDDKASTLVSAVEIKKGKEGASKLGEKIAKGAMSKSIKKVVFDRSGYLYTGKVKEIAEAARKGGLEF